MGFNISVTGYLFKYSISIDFGPYRDKDPVVPRGTALQIMNIHDRDTALSSTCSSKPAESISAL